MNFAGGATSSPSATFRNGHRTAYSVSGDGTMHFLNVADGEDVEPPAEFMPANGKAYSLNLWKNVLYSTTAQSCGGNPMSESR